MARNDAYGSAIRRHENRKAAEAEADAVASFNERTNSVFSIKFAELEKDVKEAKPETRDILLKRECYMQYLSGLGPQEPRNQGDPRYKTQKKTYDDYKKETLDPFDKETKKVEAQQHAVSEYKKKSAGVATWTFKKLEDEVNTSKPDTKNIVEKRQVYREYLKKIGADKMELSKFDSKTQEVKGVVVAEKAKPSKFTSFVSRLTSKPEVKYAAGAASPSTGAKATKAQGKKVSVSNDNVVN